MKNELEKSMQANLAKTAETKNLSKAASLVGDAMEIFESCGLHDQTDQLMNILTKMAKKNKNIPPEFLSEFDSVVDDEGVDDLLASDIEENKNKDDSIQTDFEDE